MYHPAFAVSPKLYSIVLIDLYNTVTKSNNYGNPSAFIAPFIEKLKQFCQTENIREVWGFTITNINDAEQGKVPPPLGYLTMRAIGTHLLTQGLPFKGSITQIDLVRPSPSPVLGSGSELFFRNFSLTDDEKKKLISIGSVASKQNYYHLKGLMYTQVRRYLRPDVQKIYYFDCSLENILDVAQTHYRSDTDGIVELKTVYTGELNLIIRKLDELEERFNSYKIKKEAEKIKERYLVIIRCFYKKGKFIPVPSDLLAAAQQKAQKVPALDLSSFPQNVKDYSPSPFVLMPLILAKMPKLPRPQSTATLTTLSFSLGQIILKKARKSSLTQLSDFTSEIEKIRSSYKAEFIDPRIKLAPWESAIEDLLF